MADLDEGPFSAVEAARKSQKLLSAKAVASTTELHLGGCGIDNIGLGMSVYPELQVLWLNNNHLKRVTDLEQCCRLRTMCLQNNKLTSLAGSCIQKLIALDTLMLSGNEISDLAATVRELSFCQVLRHLDLSDNPVANEQNSKEYFIFHLPQVAVLNNHCVTDVDRERAEQIARKHGWGPYAQGTPRGGAPHVAFGRRGNKRQGRPAGVSRSELERDLDAKTHQLRSDRNRMARRAEVALSTYYGPPSKPASDLTGPTEGLREPEAAEQFHQELSKAFSELQGRNKAVAQPSGDIMEYILRRAVSTPPSYSIRLPRAGASRPAHAQQAKSCPPELAQRKKQNHGDHQSHKMSFSETQLTEFPICFPAVGPTERGSSLAVTRGNISLTTRPAKATPLCM